MTTQQKYLFCFLLMLEKTLIWKYFKQRKLFPKGLNWDNIEGDLRSLLTASIITEVTCSFLNVIHELLRIYNNNNDKIIIVMPLSLGKCTALFVIY
jgi:hypothetical protein